MTNDILSPRMVADILAQSAAIDKEVAEWNAMVARLRDEETAAKLRTPRLSNYVKPMDGVDRVG